MFNSKEIETYLFEYIQQLAKGLKTREQFEKYRIYLDACEAEEVNNVIDKYIKEENDFECIEKIVAQFIRACERGLDSKNHLKTNIPFILLLLEENILIEKHKESTSKVYKELVQEYREQKVINLEKFTEFKEKLFGYIQLKPHYLKLQNTLFPSLEKHSNNMNCLKLMWHIQNKILNELKILLRLIDSKPFEFNEFNKVYGDMFLKIGKLVYRERTILFPLAIKIIPLEDFQSLMIDVDSLGVSFNAYVKDSKGGNNMSENLNNNQKRKDELNKIIKALNEAENHDSVKKEVKKNFKKLLDTLSPEEIAEAEQTLIAEGVPVEEVQKLCELHVDTFHEALKNASKRSTNGNENISGHPIANYKAENKALKNKIKEFKRAYKKLKSKENFIAFNEVLKNISLVDIHYKRKENQLFPFLEDVDFSGPSKVMWGKHDEIRDVLKKLKTASDNKNIQESISLSKLLIPKLKRMIFMEEKILFPTALRKLPQERWIDIRKGEAEIGYAWIKPGNLWAPEIAEQSTINLKSFENIQENSLIDLSVGKLSVSQIDLMLKTLPIDITFVDENDKVRYFSQGKERIFPRSPGIIGRDVQNCHPPKSVHIVQKIVDEFKAGKRDLAEFWIQMNDKFIHIRYFPLFERDIYKGVIEVSQEISSIRALEGEKRLLDEE
ncbi:MAG: DUF438 domain-containing protein [Pleomorphochaeta sp.]